MANGNLLNCFSAERQMRLVQLIDEKLHRLRKIADELAAADDADHAADLHYNADAITDLLVELRKEIIFFKNLE